MTDEGPARRPPGTLEAEVMDVLRAAGVPLSPGQVRERLAARQLEDLSYSTVVTIVSRLHAKGLLERERTGRAFAYRPSTTPAWPPARCARPCRPARTTGRC